MIFNSYLFILIYLPVCVAGWFLINRVSHRAADWYLVAMGIWFYGCFGLPYLAVLGVSSLFNYVLGRVLQGGAMPVPSGERADGQETTGGRGRRRVLLAFGVTMNLLFLGWFKYLTPELSALAESGRAELSAGMIRLISIGLPVGLSFYSFSLISYLIESYQGRLRPESLREYLLYVTYFPKMIQGPITCYEEVAAQFRRPSARQFQKEGFARGLSLFVLGLAKKLLIADVLAAPADFGLQSAYYLDTLSVLVTMSCYAMQLYMDFSGYCDMAMGVSRMLNIDLPLNFDAPFQAESFPEFWKRWHMTLTRFFTGYVYIPLGGSRRGTAQTCRNVMLVFLLSAFWHGLGGTYLVWGALSGAFVAAENLCRRRVSRKEAGAKPLQKEAEPLQEEAEPLQAGHLDARPVTACERKERTEGKKGRLTTVLHRAKVYFLFLFTLVFFGSADLEHSRAVLRRFLVPAYPGWLYRMAAKLDVPELWLLNKLVSAAAPGLANAVLLVELFGVLALALFLVNAGRTAVQLSETMELSPRNAMLIGALLVLCLCSVSGVSTYLYFQF